MVIIGGSTRFYAVLRWLHGGSTVDPWGAVFDILKKKFAKNQKNQKNNNGSASACLVF